MSRKISIIFNHKKFEIYKISKIFLLLLVIIFNSQTSNAEEFVSTNEIVKQIEKSLIFDKESKQKIDVYKDQTHYPMSREQLGINNNFNVPVS